MALEQEYSELKKKLERVELGTIVEAQKFVIEQYRNAVKVTTKKTINEFLHGYWGGKEIQDFCSSKLKAEIDFRATSKNIDSFDAEKQKKGKKAKTQQWLIERVAFYWMLFRERYDDFEFEVDPNNTQIPIQIYSAKYDLRHPNNAHVDKIEYVGFYPRSELERMSEIGTVKITLYPKQSNDDAKKGNFLLTVFYSAYRLELKGDWWEVAENKITVLRTNTEKVNIIYDDPSSQDKASDYLVLTQINLQQRNHLKHDFVLGTLNTFSRKEQYAYSSAIVFLKKEALAKQLNCRIDDDILRRLSHDEDCISKLSEIRYYLFDQKIAIKHPSTPDYQFPFFDEASQIRQFAGYYQWHYLDENDYAEVSLESSTIRICSDGRVMEVQKEGDNFSEKFFGVVRFVNTETGNIWRLNLGPHEEDHVYEKIWTLQAVRQYNRKYFKGVYLDGAYGLPQAGKIFLENVDIAKIIEVTQSQKYDPADLKWTDTELHRFFSFGSEKNYLPAYRQLSTRYTSPLPKFLQDKNLVIYVPFVYESNLDKSRKRYAYRNINLVRMPLKLMPGREFELTVKDDEILRGSYDLSHDKFILTARSSALFERFSFSLYGTQSSKNKFLYAFGVMTGFNRSQNSQANAAMLVAVPEDEHNYFIWENFKDLLTTNKQLSPQSKKAIAYLYTGRFNRIIHMPAKLNFDLKPSFDNTRRSFFYSAVHVWANKNRYSIEKWDKEFFGYTPAELCLEYLRKALIRGFATPQFLDTKRGESAYPEELKIDVQLLRDFINTIEDKSFREQIAELYSLNDLPRS
ncbi:hypothetical protein [Runella sp. SP2]|uniref:hypothetical protein n=1 Tax=Runella sp. SP2 TaxID=2268026 RepID=UPI000F0743E0|nr:hypothetical protein [Runella sp. SP2]AYQ36566.1 hypothetical protein DTQ70_30050 [Runella sp. SP2]